MKYLYSVLFLCCVTALPAELPKIISFSDSNFPDELLNKILWYAMIDCDVKADKKFDNEAQLLAFAVPIFGTPFIFSCCVKYQYVCQQWYKCIQEDKKWIKELHTHVLRSPLTYISYIVSHNLYDINTQSEKNVQRMSTSHQKRISAIQENFEKTEKKKMHLFYASEVNNENTRILKTLLHYIVFPDTDSIHSNTDKQVYLMTYFLISSKTDIDQNDALTNSNGDFTFAGLFTFLEWSIHNLEKNLEAEKVLRTEYMHALLTQKQMYAIKNPIAEEHKKGNYSAHMTISCQSGIDNKFLIDIKGTRSQDAFTERVKICIPLNVMGLSFLRVMTQATFSKVCFFKDDTSKLDMYCDGKRIFSKKFEKILPSEQKELL